MIQTALADVQATKAAWTEADLSRAINDALPDYLGGLHGDDVHDVDPRSHPAGDRQTLRGTDRGDPRRRDACRTSCGSPTAARPTTAPAPASTPPASTCAANAHCARPRSNAPPSPPPPTAPPHSSDGLRASRGRAGRRPGRRRARGAHLRRQRRIPGRAGRHREVVRRSAPSPKPGKTPTLWNGEQRRVVGLAASQIATDVLTDEGLAARNITRWLDTQHRLADGTPAR